MRRPGGLSSCRVFAMHGAMKKIALTLAVLLLAACQREVEHVVVEPDNDSVANEAREPAPKGDEQPR